MNLNLIFYLLGFGLIFLFIFYLFLKWRDKRKLKKLQEEYNVEKDPSKKLGTTGRGFKTTDGRERRIADGRENEEGFKTGATDRTGNGAFERTSGTGKGRLLSIPTDSKPIKDSNEFGRVKKTRLRRVFRRR